MEDRPDAVSSLCYLLLVASDRWYQMSRVKLLTVSTFLARVTDCRLKSSYTHALQCWADIPLAQSSSLHRYIGFLGSDSKERQLDSWIGDSP